MTNEQRQWIMDHKDSMTTREMEAVSGIAYHNIRRAIRSSVGYNVSMAKKNGPIGLGSEIVKRIEELVDMGWHPIKIAADVDVCLATVYRYKREYLMRKRIVGDAE